MSDDQTDPTRAPQAPSATSGGGSEGEVGGEAARAAQRRSELRERIAEAIREAAYVCPGGECPHTEEECGLDEQIVMAAAAIVNGVQVSTWIHGEISAIADAVMPVVDPAIERVHQMTDACDALLIEERAAHAETAERADEAEAANERVRALAGRLASGAPADDWGESISATIGADIGRAVLAALATPGPAVEDETAGGQA